MTAARIVLVALMLGLPAFAAAAPPTVNYFYPPGLQRGQSAEITASGSFSNWPVSAWVDREGLTIDATSDKGKLSVTAEEDAAPGVYWIRLYDAEGASSLRPLVVGTLPDVVEQETNDSPAKAQLLGQSSVVNGRLSKNGDVDAYSVEATAGQTLVASLLGNSLLTSPMDAVLQVCSAEGFVLAQDDDSRGLDPQIAFDVPDSGRYLVRVFAFPSQPNSSINFAGGDNFVYRLTTTTGGFLDGVLPLAVSRDASTEVSLSGWNMSQPRESQTISAPASDSRYVRVFDPRYSEAIDLPVTDMPSWIATEANSPDQPDAISIPADISGRLESAGDVDVFRFSAIKGKKTRFQIIARSLLLPTDAVLRVADSTGKLLSEVDDVAKKADPELVFTPPADGEYFLSVFDLHHRGGSRFAYRMTATEVRPDFALTLAEDHFVVQPGKPLEITVAVDRREGFADSIEIVAVGLPEGISAAAVTSTVKGESAKSIKLTLTADKSASSGIFRVVGKSHGELSRERVADFATTDERWRGVDAWLTVGSSAGGSK